MEYYKLSLPTKTLTISKKFEDAVSTCTGPEYHLYCELMNQIPELKVVRKTHKTPTKYITDSGEVFRCNQFKNLKYSNMEAFIECLDNADEYFEQYYNLKNGLGNVQVSRYALVRKWFVKQFPLYRTDPCYYLRNEAELVKSDAVITNINRSEESKVA